MFAFAVPMRPIFLPACRPGRFPVIDTNGPRNICWNKRTIEEYPIMTQFPPGLNARL